MFSKPGRGGGGEPGERSDEFGDPGPALRNADAGLAGGAGDAGGYVQQPVAQLLRLSLGQFTVQQVGLSPRDQVDRDERELQPAWLMANLREESGRSRCP